MLLVDFLNLPDEHSLSADDAQSLNRALATTKIDEIPEEHRVRVREYITVALVIDTVPEEYKPSIEKLLLQLQ